MPAAARTVDMTNVKDGGGKFNTKRIPEGDYRLRILDVEDAEVKGGDNKGEPVWVFIMQVVHPRYGSGKYPYRCTLVDNQYWKIRNLLVAAGITVPKKRVKVDPNKLIGKEVAGTMEDDEYEGKPKSQIQAIFPVSELIDDDNEPDDVEEEEPDTEEEVEEEEVEEEPEPAPVRRTAKKTAAKKTAAKKPASVVEDDELEELDIEDL